MGRVVGIDLGTTYSAVAIVNDLEMPEIIPNREGDRITPSVVLLQDGFVQVGTQAKRSAANAPDDVVMFVKRQMGDPTWRFVSSSGAEYSAEQISAMILKRLKEDAELMLGEPVSSAVITVPAYFDDARRKATMDAGQMAGLEVLRVLNEPTAAAISFGLDTDYEGTVMVYDLGGGTFDVTVMRISADSFDVLATDGDRNLGGFNWDNAMMSLVNDQVQAAGGPDLFTDEALLADLRDKAETAKRTLSNLPEARIFLSAGGRHHNVTVTRADFERATEDLMARTEIYIDKVLEDAGLKWADIGKILLVGGSTRMPMVHEQLARLSGKTPERTVHPDEAVALGAAVQAHLSARAADGGTTLPVPMIGGRQVNVYDVTSQSLGVIALNPQGVRENSIIIPHNTKIPVQRSRTYTTVQDQQTEISIEITEGDDVDPDFVSIVHREPMPIPPYPRGAPIEVVMSYDIDAVIHVEVRDLTAGKTLGEVELDRPSNLERAQVEAMTELMRELEVY